MVEIHALLKLMVDQNASDLFLTAGASPHLKVDGITRPINLPAFKAGEVKQLAYSVMSERQLKQFEATLECNLSFSLEGVARYRVNVYYQRNEVAMVVRMIKSHIPSLTELGLPPEVGKLSMLKRGLVLIVGAAGSGKSTTLASMVDTRASHADGHILTIEDPIEFLFQHRRALVDQREVGIDTLTFGDALRNAMRESPDVIVIGEIRDQETARHALSYAETGHLCLSTLHANNANQAIERILNFFPAEAQRQLLMDMSLNLKGVISQRLIPSVDGGRALAVEVLLLSAYIADLIHKGRVDEIRDAMAMGNEVGMKTFDQSLFELYVNKRITLEEALQNADSRTDLALRIRLSEHHSAVDVPALTMSAADFSKPRG